MEAAAKNADFVATVAEHFVARRGRGAILSPADLACLAEWERAGVDAAAAVRGIDEAFRRSGEIRSLRQCNWAVQAEVRRSQAGGRGPDEAAADEIGITAKLAALAASLAEAANAAEDSGIKSAIRDAEAAVRKLAEKVETETAGRVQNELDKIEMGLISKINTTLPAEEAARLEREGRAELRGRDLDADVARRTVRAITARKLRERFSLPSFTI